MLLSNPYNPDDRVRNEALALYNAGYSVTILAWDRDCIRPEREVQDGLEIRRTQISAGYKQGAKQLLKFLRVWKWYFSQMKTIRPVIIHCHDLDTLPAGVCYSLLNKNKNLVFDAHESYYVMKKPDVSLLVSFFIKLSEKIFTPLVNLLIAPCQATAEYYRKSGAKKIMIVGNWKRPQDFMFESRTLEEKRRSLGIGNQLVIVYIGRLSAERIVIPLVEAVRENPKFFLILGGYGEQEEILRNKISNVENIYFPGYIHPDDVPIMTALADIVYYGFNPDHPFAAFNAPNKLYESLAAGKAFLAADIGGELSDVIKSSNNGILLSSLDVPSVVGALKMISENNRLEKMKQNAAKAGLNNYNWSIAEERLLNAYSELLKTI